MWNVFLTIVGCIALKFETMKVADLSCKGHNAMSSCILLCRHTCKLCCHCANILEGINIQWVWSNITNGLLLQFAHFCQLHVRWCRANNIHWRTPTNAKALLLHAHNSSHVMLDNIAKQYYTICIRLFIWCGMFIPHQTNCIIYKLVYVVVFIVVITII